MCPDQELNFFVYRITLQPTEPPARAKFATLKIANILLKSTVTTAII